MNKRPKKLNLTREHVRILTDHQLRESAGGGATIGFYCNVGPSRDACTIGISCIASGDKCY